MTRLYYTEQTLKRFDARVVRAEDEVLGHQRVWLDRTAFYPTSGGQPFDTGHLNQAAVADVVDDDGQVVHLVDGRFAPGDAVVGVIDWPRRFDHMQQHTGQHLLSAAFEHVHQVRTESFRLGADCSTIDLAREVSLQEIEAAEDDANRVVWEGRSVSIRFVSEKESACLPLRKEPSRSGPLRLIEIAGYDLSACGGTHVATTSEVGLVVVRAWERFRGGTRLEFVCGGRALANYRSCRTATTNAARVLSVTAEDVPLAVERLQAELKESRHLAARLGERAAEFEAGTLASRSHEIGRALVFVSALDGYDVAALKRLAATFVKQSGRVIVLFTASQPLQVIAARSTDLNAVDCRRLLQELFARSGGRGGGKPESAQGGGVTATTSEVVTWVETALARQLAQA
ncbi:MAG: DHHA1 domain-containing protein [Vicinamibacterales bacterium]